jgi:hypothetical protein
MVAAIQFSSELFTQVDLDSGALTLLGSIIHRLTEPGRYRGTVLQGDDDVADFRVDVTDDAPDEQIGIDLAELASPFGGEPCTCDEDVSAFRLRPGGYALFSVSRGRGGYAVLVGAERQERGAELDSRRLRPGDLFTATMLRPGDYALANTEKGADGSIQVSYPELGEAPYRPSAPLSIACTERGFEPDHIRVGPAQGQIYECQVTARIRITLRDPDDRPRRPRRVVRGPSGRLRRVR